MSKIQSRIMKKVMWERWIEEGELRDAEGPVYPLSYEEDVNFEELIGKVTTIVVMWEEPDEKTNGTDTAGPGQPG